MPDTHASDHPDIETLSGFSEGRLEATLSETVGKHVEDCVACRLEIKRLRRFETIETDDALAGEAGWNRAGPALEQALNNRILPAAGVGTDKHAPTRQSRARWHLRWLTPAVAAAAVVVLLVSVFDGGSPDDPGVMRGPEAPAHGIVTGTPSGEIPGPPEVFEWSSAVKHDYYTVEIRSTDLQRIHTQTGIPDTRWAPVDSVTALFEPGTIYLWNVVGHRGVEEATVSPNGWFKITPENNR